MDIEFDHILENFADVVRLNKTFKSLYMCLETSGFNRSNRSHDNFSRLVNALEYNFTIINLAITGLEGYSESASKIDEYLQRNRKIANIRENTANANELSVQELVTLYDQLKFYENTIPDFPTIKQKIKANLDQRIINNCQEGTYLSRLPNEVIQLICNVWLPKNIDKLYIVEVRFESTRSTQ